MPPLCSDEIKLLTEVGFLAASRGEVAQAEGIFSGLQRLRPERGFSYIGLAVALLNNRRYDQAATLLFEALERVNSDERDEVNAFLGLALQLGGRTSESLRALQAASKSHLAQMMLGQCATAPDAVICKGSS